MKGIGKVWVQHRGVPGMEPFQEVDGEGVEPMLELLERESSEGRVKLIQNTRGQQGCQRDSNVAETGERLTEKGDWSMWRA